MKSKEFNYFEFLKYFSFKYLIKKLKINEIKKKYNP